MCILYVQGVGRDRMLFYLNFWEFVYFCLQVGRVERLWPHPFIVYIYICTEQESHVLYV